MAFDYSKLTGRIVEKYGTRAAFAEAAGFTEGQLSRRLNNLTPFEDRDIYLCCQLLGIPDSDVTQYFFKPKVR